MEQYIVATLSFSVGLLVFWGALKFSKYKSEKNEECVNEEDCSIKSLGIKNLKCNH